MTHDKSACKKRIRACRLSGCCIDYWYLACGGAALPQYQKAVLNAKIARDLPLLVSLPDVREMYNPANGIYALRLDGLNS